MPSWANLFTHDHKSKSKTFLLYHVGAQHALRETPRSKEEKKKKIAQHNAPKQSMPSVAAGNLSFANTPPLDKLSYAWSQEKKSNECVLFHDGIQPALQGTGRVKNLRHDNVIEREKVLPKDENPHHQHAKSSHCVLLPLSFVNTTCPRIKKFSPERWVAE